MVIWEYIYLAVSGKDENGRNHDISPEFVIDQLNIKGQEGWELVTPWDHEIFMRYFLFKRPIAQTKYPYEEDATDFLKKYSPTIRFHEVFTPGLELIKPNK